MHPDVGQLSSGKCYVFLEGYGLNREPFCGTEYECLAAIAMRGGVADPIPTDKHPNGVPVLLSDLAALAALAAPAELISQSQHPTPAGTKDYRRSACPAKLRRQLREFLVSIEFDGTFYSGICVIRSYEITVDAYDHRDAIKQGRENYRELMGHGRQPAIFKARINK